MTTDRSYRKAMPLEEAVAELRRVSGTQFDPAVVDALIASREAQAELVAVPLPKIELSTT
jgi:HD-GYP domain-containing protein (c-di-GMP phosphodiesterase class II)